GRDPENRDERRQAEDDRDAYPEREAPNRCERMPEAGTEALQEPAHQMRDDELDGDAEDHSRKRSRASQENRLAEVQQQDLPRAQSQALQDGVRVHPSREPGGDRLRDADSTYQEREQ